MSLQQLVAKNIEDVLVPNESVNRDALLQLKQSLDPVAGKYTPLGAIHVNGLKSDQVWVQAQMILEGVTEKLNERINQYKGDAGDDDSAESDTNLEDLSEEDFSQEEQSEEDPEEEDVDVREEEIDPNMHDDYDESDYATAEEPEEEHARRSREEEEEEEEEESEEEPTNGPKQDNFDLAEFQQHVLQLENDDDDEEDVDIDWNADVPESESEDEDMHFKDFFAPPQPKKVKKERRIEEVHDDDNDNNSEADEDEEEDVMETTRRDLFSDEDEDEDEDNEGGQANSQPMSKFERQQQELAEQIDQLENENIGEKEWGMKGEAQAKDRPEESLFNLQFERNVKAAPVITEESTVSIEDLIKDRIRKQRFDDIPRRSELAPQLRKELPELSDQKSQKSLAELYESDQMREQNPDYYAKQDSQVMDAAHQEVVDLFTSVSRKLDALCSWQYTPRPAAPSLNITTDTPSIAMEEAQPGTMSLESQQAPQEVYRSESAVPMANQEMTTSMKRKRRRDKAKAHAERATAKESASKRSGKKEEMFNTLKRGNVTMVDKRGQKHDMQGNAVKENQQTASNIKL